MKPRIDLDLCIGCSTCSALCPQVFSLRAQENGELKAVVAEGVDYDALKKQIDDAILSCPTAAISEEN